MSTSYNPKLPTNDILLYLDSNNIKSFSNNGFWSSMLGNYTVEINPIYNNGFISTDTVCNKTIIASDINNYDKISIVLSLKSISNGYGTIFSLCGSNSSVYTPSTITLGYTSNQANSNAISSVAFTTNIANTIIASSYTSSQANSVALSTVQFTTNIANTIITSSYVSTQANSNAISSVAFTTNIENTIIASSYTSSQANSSALTQEIYNDFLTNSLSIVVDKDQLISEVIDNYYVSKTKANLDISQINDIFTFIFDKTLNSISIYKNRNLISSYTGTNINNFGNILSILSKNGQGNFTNIPIRSVLIYSKELTQEEISTISSAIKQNQ